MTSYTEGTELKYALKRLDGDKILPTNKKIIRKYINKLLAEGQIKNARARRIVDVMRFWAQLLNKDLRKATRKDIEKAVLKLQQDKVMAKKFDPKKQRDKSGKLKMVELPFAKATKEMYKAVLKQFYKATEGKGEEVPKRIRWLKVRLGQESNKLPEDIYTEKEIKKMIDAATNVRDRAIIAVLYETGTRISEFLNMKIKDIEKEEKGYRILLNGKTGTRKILISTSIPHLQPYLKIHPWRDVPEAPLWYSKYGEKGEGIHGLSYEYLKLVIREIGKKAGIKKRLHAHAFRHSKITHSGKWMTDGQRAAYFGHQPGSKMLRKYSHMSGADCDDAVLAMAGKEVVFRKSELAPKVCNICEHDNDPDEEWCQKCGRAISEKALVEEMKGDAKISTMEKQLVEMQANMERMSKKIADTDMTMLGKEKQYYKEKVRKKLGKK